MCVRKFQKREVAIKAGMVVAVKATVVEKGMIWFRKEDGINDDSFSGIDKQRRTLEALAQ